MFVFSFFFFVFWEGTGEESRFVSSFFPGLSVFLLFDGYGLWVMVCFTYGYLDGWMVGWMDGLDGCIGWMDGFRCSGM